MRLSRRSLIHAGCAVAAVTLAPHFLDVAEARRLRGGTSVITGRSVQNGFEVKDCYTFINFFKSWGASGSVSFNGNNLATALNSNGFPEGTLTGNLGGSIFLSPNFYLGSCRMKWTGTIGNLTVGLSMTATSGGSFLSGANFSGVNGDVTFTINPLTTSSTTNTLGYGAQTFTVGSGLGLNPGDKITLAQTASLVNYMIGTVTSYAGTSLVVSINNFYGSGTFSSWNVWATPSGTNTFFNSGVANTGLSSIILCKASDYTAITNGEIFNPDFLSVVAALNPKYLRPMGATLSGGSETITNPLYAYRRPSAYMSYATLATYPAGAYASNSSGVNVLTTASYPDMPGSWTDKETFLFNAPANSVTVTVASPARLALPKTVVVGEIIALRTTGALPTGLTASGGNVTQNSASVGDGVVTWYYALDAGSTNIRVAATPGGAAINTSGTQSGSHSMSVSTGLPITAVANNGSNLCRCTLPSTSGLTTNDIVQVYAGPFGAFKITVIDATHIDLASSYPSGAVIPFIGQSWSTTSGQLGQSYLTNTTINVNGRGAKQLVASGGLPLPPGNLALEIGNFIGINTCVYDSVLDAVVSGPDGLYVGTLSWDQQFALANKLNKNLWIDPGVMTPDASVTSIVQAAASALNSNLTLLLAYSNETWNTAFPQYYYMVRRGIALGFSASSSGIVQQALTATGLRTIQVLTAGKAAWIGAGRSAASFKRVISWQGFGGTTDIQAFLLNGQDLSAPNNASPNRPIDFADVGTFADYHNGVLLNGQYGTAVASDYAALTTQADNYAGGNAGLMAAAITWMSGDYLGTNGTATPPGVVNFSVSAQSAGIWTTWEAMMASYDAGRAGFTPALAPIDIIAYEGGPDLVPPSTSSCTNIGISTAYAAKISNLLDAWKNDPASATAIRTACSTFVSGTFPHNKAPSFLQLEGPNEWSLLSGDFQSRPYQMYFGAQAYNA